MKINTTETAMRVRLNLAKAFGGHSQYSLLNLGEAILGTFNNGYTVEGDDEYVSALKAFKAVLKEALFQEEDFWQEEFSMTEKESKELLEKANAILDSRDLSKDWQNHI